MTGTRKKEIQTTSFHIKNMVCTCCAVLLKQTMEQKGISVNEIRVGFLDASYDSNVNSEQDIIDVIEKQGLEIITDREEQIVEQVKKAVIELVHHLNNVDTIVRKSEYLVEKIGLSYQHISKIFSKHEKITLERYIILNKIERIKELIDSNEYTLSEIAYMMDYSSVQHLSNQFKKITELSVSEYKSSDRKSKKPLDRLY